MDEIQISKNTLMIAGVTLDKDSLVISNTTTDEQLNQIGNFLRRVEESKQWWWGDFLCHIEGRKGEHYTGKWIEFAGLEAQTMRVYKAVSGFFDPEFRRSGLTHAHHRLAMEASEGRIETAMVWLDRAVEGKWNVAAMRKAIRQDQRTITDNDPPPPPVHYSSLIDADHWASSGLQQVRAMTRTDKYMLWTKIQGLVGLVDYLRSEIDE